MMNPTFLALIKFVYIFQYLTSTYTHTRSLNILTQSSFLFCAAIMKNVLRVKICENLCKKTANLISCFPQLHIYRQSWLVILEACLETAAEQCV